MGRQALIFLHVLAFVTVTNATTLKPKIYLLQDSVMVGEWLNVGLSYTHAIATDVAFPDSTTNVGLFEYVAHHYTPTRSDSVNSVDSVIYTLRTFATTDSIKLALPVFIILNNDTINLTSDTVYVKLKRTLATLPENIVFKKETDFKTPDYLFPWSFWVLLGIVIISLLVVVFFVFKRPIQRKIYLYRMAKKHDAFTEAFQRLEEKVMREAKTADADQLLGIWKKYLDYIDEKGVSSLTTTEISQVYNETALLNALKQIDKFIYAGDTLTLNEAISVLHDFAEQQYTFKINNEQA